MMQELSRRNLVARWVRRGGVAVGAAALAALAGGVMLQGEGSKRSAEVPKAAGALRGDVGEAQVLSFDITTTVTGDLRAKKQKEVRSELEVESSIMEVVPEGTAVKKGDLLVRLNSDQIKNQLDQEQLNYENSKADVVSAENAYSIQLSENESRVRAGQLKLDLAQLELKQWENGERVQKLQDIDLALDRTSKDLERVTDKYARSLNLHEQGFLSKDELQRDEISLREAKAARAKAELEQKTYTSYQEPRERKQKESNVDEAKAELERVKQQNEIQLASKEADRTNKRRQLELRKERVEKLQKQYDSCTIVAPEDGLVVYGASMDGDNFWNQNGPLQVGRRVNPNEVLITLPDTREMMAQVKVPESLAGRVRPGLDATVRIDALPGQSLSGQIESIGVLAEGGGWRDPNRREYTVKIAIEHDSSSTPLKPSMRCEATLVLGRVEDATAVPLQAIFNEGRLSYVWVPEGSRYRRVPVQIGRRSDTLAEIRAGLTAGAAVLLREPASGERLNVPWGEEELKAVGFRLADNGQPEPIPGVGGPPGGGRRGRGGPPAGVMGTNPPAAVTPTSAPAATGGGQ